MTAYRVTAIGAEGTEFVYEIDGDDTLTPREAVLNAYWLHGQSVGLGDQTELLGPQNAVQEI